MAESSPATLAGIAVEPGRRILHRLVGAVTHGGFAVELPLHLLFGSSPGPTLIVQAGLSGLELEPALTLPGLVAGIDPATLRGNLIVAPLVNLSGFEFEQSRSAWDDVDLNAIGAGRPDGTVSEQLIHAYASTVIAHADALIDVRSGSQWSYHAYASVQNVGSQARIDSSMDLAASLGLPHAALDEPVGATLVGAMAARGTVAVTAWVGGGPGLRDHRERDAALLTGVVQNALCHLGMREGDAPATAERVRVHTVLRPTSARGFTFMHQQQRGQRVEAGAELGYVRHPFDGTRLASITAPRAGIVLHAGASWPVVPEGTTLAILADPL